MPSLIDDVVRRTGLPPPAAEDAIRAAVEVLGAEIGPAARDELLGVVPPSSVVPPWSGGPASLAGDPGDLIGSIARALGLRPDEALEAAQVVCQAIHDRLSPEVRALAAGRLSPAVRELLREPPAPDPPAEERRHATGHTLATGRPGSSHPVSEGRPHGGQRESVVRADNPHGGDKLSSSAPAPGTAGGGGTLAEGRPGGSRPLSEERASSDGRESIVHAGRPPAVDGRGGGGSRRKA